jgi:hypothetical protein
VAKHAKSLTAAAVVVILSIMLVNAGFVGVGVGLLVVGLLGTVVLYEYQDRPDGDGGDGKSKLDRAIEDRDGAPAETGPPAPGPTAPPGGALPTWRPVTPSQKAPDAASTPLLPAEPRPTALPPREHPAAWDDWQDTDRGPVAEEYDADNPLAALDRLDEIDPIAEVERIEGLANSGTLAAAPPTAFSFASAPRPINEAAVQTPADIMAASEATELHVGSGEVSELARLLAKVQQRLAAYE